VAHSRNCFRSSCIAAVALRFLIAQTAAAWVGVTTTALQELEVQQVELTQARKLLVSSNFDPCPSEPLNIPFVIGYNRGVCYYVIYFEIMILSTHN
jgi:hypothetical protein